VTDDSFIPIAPTFITKALVSIITRHNSTQPRSSHIAGGANDPNLHLIAATCNGDLRSAINSLQMLKTGIQKKRKSLPSMDELMDRKRPKGRGSRGGKGSKIAADEEVRIAYVSSHSAWEMS
jgi:cell cycle checkpoint protein